MKKIFKKLFKIFLWLTGLFIIFLVALFIFIQTDMFNNLALDFATKKLNEGWNEKESVISAGSISGNIFSNLMLEDILITVKSDTIIKINTLSLKYDIWGLLDKQIRLENVIINSPDINFTKISDSTGSLIWNFSKLFSSAEEDKDTSGTGFDWDIELNDLKILNGSFTTNTPVQKQTDSLTLQNDSLNNFNFENLKVSDLNADLNAEYFTDNKILNLNNLSFKTGSGFRIDTLSFKTEINLKDTTIDLDNLKFITGRSDIRINKIHINKLNPFDSTTFINFKEKFFEADFNIAKLDFDDVKYFIPDVEYLDSTISLTVNAKGKYGDFDLADLTLRLPDSYINLTGNVQNLDEPDSLYLDIIANDLSIQTADFKKIYNDNSMEDYSHLGKVNADITFTGTVNKFFTQFDINTNAGSSDGILNLDLTEKSYNGKISTKNLNLGNILKDNSMKSNLNLFADFTGRGFDLKSMAASVKFNISRSSFAGYDVSRSAGKIDLRNSNVNLNILFSSSIANIVTSGRINIANMNNPAYSLKGKVNNLNIAGLTNDNNDESNLNFEFDVNGRGIDPDNILGKFNFDIQNSSYAENNIPAVPLNIEIENNYGARSYKIMSDAFDLNASGDFKFGSLSKVLSTNIGLISDRFKSRLLPDSTAVTYESQTNSNLISNVYDDISMDFQFIIKDTAAADMILKPFGILIDGNIKGSILNSSDKFSLSTDIILDKFIFRDTVIILQNFKSDLSLSNNYLKADESGSITPFEITLNADGDKIVYQNSPYDSVKVDLDLKNSAAEISIKAKQDSSLSAFITGNIDLSKNIIAADFDSVRVKYQSSLIENNKNLQIGYIPDDQVTFDQFALKSENVILNLKGNYSLSGSSDLSLEGESIPLSDIYSIIFPVDTAKVLARINYPVKGNINKLFLNFKGNIEEPLITADIQSGNLVYSGIDEDQDVGNFQIKLNYENESADTKINFNNASSKGQLSITGTIPVENPLIEKDTLAESNLTGPVDLKFSSKNFELKYFLKIFPSIPEIAGKLNGDIAATGNATSPDLKGSIAIDDGNFFLDMTGMNYKFKLKTSTENSKLVINNLSMSSTGDVDRHFDIMGNIDFSGMKINDIDLTTSGDMVFLDNNVTQNSLGIYGYFRAGSGSPGIKIKGNLDKLSITGQLLIVDATISSVPIGGTGYDNVTDNFTYILESNSAVVNYEPEVITEESNFYKIDPFKRSRYILEGSQSSAANFLDIDINVKTQDKIYASIDFDNITRDRLFGELKADLNIKTRENEFQAFGEVDISDDSYYRFYKDFKIRNSSISFNGPITNPDLDIQAVYEAVKTTEEFGTSTSIPVEVKLTINGTPDEPEIALNLVEDGTEVSGTDAQADAITFLLFGKYKSELSTSQRTSIASSLGTSLGSLYISSIVSQTVREILPFLVDAQFKYSEGNVTDTDVELTSEIGEATVKVGGKLLKNVRNFEFEIEYPLNNFLNLDLPETLLLVFSREEESNVIFGSSETSTNTGIKVVYKIKY